MNLKKEMNINVYTAAGTAVGLLAAGGLGGWLCARAYLSRGFYRKLDEEMDAIRLHYLNKLEKEAGPAEVLRLAAEGDSAADHPAGDEEDAQRDDGGDGGEEAPEPDGSGDSPDADETRRPFGEYPLASLAPVGEPEEDDRDHSRPYPISPAEFANTEPGWEAISLTYYAGDGVLADDEGNPIINYTKLVGELLPGHFGGISGAANLRIIRNDGRECDFEITMHETSYADEVLNYGKPK
jgi:hypothetical protein